eukprot:m.239303 g.239303  ORF g.239303 m.239303 type:complete len:150 (+) comp16065_c0_seq9:1222-1671(+)
MAGYFAILPADYKSARLLLVSIASREMIRSKSVVPGFEEPNESILKSVENHIMKVSKKNPVELYGGLLQVIGKRERLKSTRKNASHTSQKKVSLVKATKSDPIGKRNVLRPLIKVAKKTKTSKVLKKVSFKQPRSTLEIVRETVPKSKK